MGLRRLGWAMLCLCLAVATWAQNANPPRPRMVGTWETVKQLEDQVKAMRAQGQAQQAWALCEQFIVDNPNAGWITGIAVERAMDCLRDLGPTPAEREPLYQRVLRLYPNVPWYHAMVTQELGGAYLHGTQGFQPDAAKALEVLRDAFDRYVGKLPGDLYILHFVGQQEALALSRNGLPDEARAKIRSVVARCPLILLADETINVWAQILVAGERTKDLPGVAKLGYVTCDYEPKALKRALDTCQEALRAEGEPGRGVLFARSQSDRSLENPLAAVALPDLGPPADLLTAAGDDPNAQVTAYLALGRVAEALTVAKKQLAEWTGGDEAKLARTMNNVARCLKAHDLSLSRANAFLEYHRTGEGEDPLPAVEAELAAGATP